MVQGGPLGHMTLCQPDAAHSGERDTLDRKERGGLSDKDEDFTPVKITGPRAQVSGIGGKMNFQGER